MGVLNVKIGMGLNWKNFLDFVGVRMGLSWTKLSKFAKGVIILKMNVYLNALRIAILMKS